MVEYWPEILLVCTVRSQVPTKKIDGPGHFHSDLAGSFSGQGPVQYLENYGPSMEQSDWSILVIGPLNLLSRVINVVIYQQRKVLFP